MFSMETVVTRVFTISFFQTIIEKGHYDLCLDIFFFFLLLEKFVSVFFSP